MVKSVKTSKASEKNTRVAKKAPVKKAAKPRASIETPDVITSKKYTNMFAAYRAFWQRGFTDWRGTTSRSGYWWVVLANALIVVVLLGLYARVGYALSFNNVGGGIVLLFMATTAILVLYALAMIVPSISIVLRRLHDGGFSSWWILLYPATLLPYIGWFAGVVLLIFMLMPTRVDGNPYHKFNK